jgi:hypothetical protein
MSNARSAAEMSRKAADGGYGMDPFVGECLEALASLEADASSFKRRAESAETAVAQSKPSRWPLAVAVGAFLLSCGIIAFLLNRVSADVERIAMLQAVTAQQSAAIADMRSAVGELRASVGAANEAARSSSAATASSQQATSAHISALERLLLQAEQKNIRQEGQGKEAGGAPQSAKPLGTP